MFVDRNRLSSLRQRRPRGVGTCLIARPLLGACLVTIGLLGAAPWVPAEAGTEGQGRLLEYFRRDTGRVGPERLAERYATVVGQLTGLGLESAPPIEQRSMGEILAAYRTDDLHRHGLPERGSTSHQARLFKHLRLLPEDAEPGACGTHTAEARLAGLYDLQSKQILLARDSGRKVNGSVLLHEIVHAAQDQAIGIGALQERAAANLDASLALSALLEGQAEAATLLYRIRSANADRTREIIDGLLAGPLAPTMEAEQDRCGAFSRFPYLAGTRYVLHRYRNGEKDFAEMLAHPPVSTERILHPHAGQDADDPPAPALASRTSAAAAVVDGRILYETTLGELALAQVLREMEAGAAAAAGWGSDLVLLVEHPRGDLVILDSSWDSDKDAREFDAAVREWTARTLKGGREPGADGFDAGFGDGEERAWINRTARRVLILIGSDPGGGKIGELGRLLQPPALGATSTSDAGSVPRRPLAGGHGGETPSAASRAIRSSPATRIRTALSPGRMLASSAGRPLPYFR